MTLKILLLTEVFPPRKGGSGRWFWELYRRLPDCDVQVVTAPATDSAPFDASSGLSIVRLPIRFSNWGAWDPRGGWRYARAFAHLARVVSRVRPDVTHAGKCLPEGLLALALQRWHGIPFWCYAHGEELTLAATSRELRWLTGRVLRGASRVVANSQFTNRLLVEEWGIPAAKIALLHPGVDTSRFVPAPRNADVRERLGWANRSVILTVGALQKRKGQDMLIRALPAIRRRCPDVLYSVAGEGWERPYLDELVRELAVGDVVQFRGVPADEEMIHCYQQCDVFALPNRRIGWDVEGFGIVLLEAQAAGKPVVAGMSGGTADTLRPGETGELVNCDAPDALADVVGRLLTDTARARLMGEHARRWVVERFDWDRLAQQAVEIFQAPAPVVRARTAEVSR